jgi:dTDP-4-dehydrorhamnose reductase
VRVDEAEAEPGRCRRENADGAAVLAMECAARGLPLVTFSSDLVFDGSKSAPYVESDPVAPLNAYGRSKAEAEAQVMDACPSALVVRTSAFFGPWDSHNFVSHNVVTVALRELEAGRPFAAADDATVSPTYVPDLANACLDLLIDGERGIWHLANPGAITWADLARREAELAGVDARLLHPRPTREVRVPRAAVDVHRAGERARLAPSAAGGRAWTVCAGVAGERAGGGEAGPRGQAADGGARKVIAPRR